MSISDDNPFVYMPLKERLRNLKRQLEELPKDLKEPKIKLLFSGDAVFGSLGIKSSFVCKTINPIQELIKIQTTITKFGKEFGKRGKIKKGEISEMYLTSLPTGSFGYELSLLNNVDLFEEQDVSESIYDVIELIEITVRDEEKFLKVMDEYPNKTLSYLKNFLKEVNSENSILKIESGSTYKEFSRDEIKIGYDRVSSTIFNEEIIMLNGIFKGAFIESGKFELLDNEGNTIHGFISDELSEEEIAQYNRDYSNVECNITLEKGVTEFNNGKMIITYILLSLKEKS
ncbi:MAG: hypothetical protein PHO63_06130 [Bacilli bacterium]|nr:hypothetical protein [Bacilli bacterium]